MNKKMKVSMPIEIPQLDEDVNVDLIEQKLNEFLDLFSDEINVDDIEDWNILILITLRSTDSIGVFKRIRRYSSDKEIEISISIPIPKDTQIDYGLKKVEDAFYLPLNNKNFYILMPEFNNYLNLFEYILESSKKAIQLAFTNGISCNGKKINLKK